MADQQPLNPLQHAGRLMQALQQHPLALHASATLKRWQDGADDARNLYNTALICRLVLTWFPNPPEFILNPLVTLCDPYLNLFRGLIPPLGGSLDLSPILAFVVLNLFSSTAAALPAELGPDGKTPVARQVPQQAGPMQWLQPSRYQQMWAKRVHSQRLRRAAEGAERSDAKP